MEGEALEEVEAFIYLGNIINKQGCMGVNVKNRESKRSILAAMHNHEHQQTLSSQQVQAFQHQHHVSASVQSGDVEDGCENH